MHAGLNTCAFCMRRQTLLPRCNVAAMVTLQPAMFLNRTPEQIQAQVGSAYEIIARDLPLPYVDAMVQVRKPLQETLIFHNRRHVCGTVACWVSLLLPCACLPGGTLIGGCICDSMHVYRH